jgi:hypothetical protein
MTIKRKNPPEVGDRRIVRKFLFFPTEIEEKTKWFKIASIVQEYRSILEWDMSGEESCSTSSEEWVNVAWADEWSKIPGGGLMSNEDILENEVAVLEETPDSES